MAGLTPPHHVQRALNHKEPDGVSLDSRIGGNSPLATGPWQRLLAHPSLKSEVSPYWHMM